NRAGDAGMFGRDKYHGAVIWGWPQSMVLRGISRQAKLFRGDAEVQEVLARAHSELSASLKRAGKFSSSELWTWGAKGGRIQAEAFGKSSKDTDESNALQLW